MPRPILTILNEIAVSLGFKFRNVNPNEQNLQGDRDDEADSNILYLTEPLVSTHALGDTSGSRLTTTWPLELYFLQRSRLEFEQQEHDVIISDMREAALDFLKALHVQQIPTDGRLEFKSLNSIIIENVINLYDSNFTGVKLNVDAETLIPDSLC